jgi:hypothetical protein
MLGDTEKGRQIRTIDRLAFEQQFDDLVEHGAVLREQFRCSGLGLSKKSGDLLVDGPLGFFGVRTAGKGVVPTRTFGTVTNGADLGRETPFTYHASGDAGRIGEVVGDTRRSLPANQYFRSTPAEPDRQGVGELALGIEVALEFGQLFGHPECGPTGQDVTLATGSACSERTATRAWPASWTATECFLLRQQRVRGITGADEETVPGRTEVGGREHLTMVSHGVDGRFVHQVC